MPSTRPGATRAARSTVIVPGPQPDVEQVHARAQRGQQVGRGVLGRPPAVRLQDRLGVPVRVRVHPGMVPEAPMPRQGRGWQSSADRIGSGAQDDVGSDEQRPRAKSRRPVDQQAAGPCRLLRRRVSSTARSVYASSSQRPRTVRSRLPKSVSARRPGWLPNNITTPSLGHRGVRPDREVGDQRVAFPHLDRFHDRRADPLEAHRCFGEGPAPAGVRGRRADAVAAAVPAGCRRAERTRTATTRRPDRPARPRERPRPTAPTAGGDAGAPVRRVCTARSIPVLRGPGEARRAGVARTG